MSSIVHLPEQFKIVSGTPVVTTNAEVTCDYVSLKNVNMAWIVLSFLQAATDATIINPRRATAVAPTGSVAIAHSAPNWKNADVSASDTLVRGADATTATLTAGTTDQLVIVQIDPAQLGDTYDVLGCVIDASGEATNFVVVNYFLEMRYAQATPPSVIVD
jgi:hypothetical protein